MYEAAGIGFSIGGSTILHRIDLAFRPGEVTAIVGPNGAGKSTLLRVMAGERRPDAGRVLLHGADIAALGPRALAGMRAVLSQSVTLAFPFTVAEVVRLGLLPSPHMAAARDGLVRRALDMVDLAGMEGRDCTSLSGGEQQRVHLARVMVQLWSAGREPPGFLLLDEPTASLDLAHQLQALAIARRHAAEGGGVVAILHDLNLAAAAADRIVAMDAGRVVADGRPDAVVTDRLLGEVYGVDLRVNTTHGEVFVLPRRPHPPEPSEPGHDLE